MPVSQTAPPAEPAPSRPHIPQLDGLRGIAILMVFVFHAFKANLLWMGVDLFFVLSGFLITGILLKEKSRRFGAYIGAFYARRARRILPAYGVMLLISAAIFGVAWLRYWYVYLGAMNLLVQFGIPHLDVHPLWSLAVEEQFYLLWPLAVFTLSRRRLLVLAWSLLVLAPILRLICTPLFATGYAIYMLLPFRMDTLAAGALMAIYWPDLQKRIQSEPATRTVVVRRCCAVFAAGLALALISNGFGIKPNSVSPLGDTALLEASVAICWAMFVLALIGVGKTFLSSWPMAKLGMISYSFYLFHQIGLYLAPHHNGIIGFILTVIYSAVMWVLIEGPILNRRRKPAPAPA